MLHTYKDLIVWNKSMDLVVLIYDLLKDYPSSELFVLSAQTKRSAISIPSNIAEGRKRGSRSEYRNYLFIAYGSASELETQLAIGERLNYANRMKLKKTYDLLTEITKMLNKMIATLFAPPK